MLSLSFCGDIFIVQRLQSYLQSTQGKGIREVLSSSDFCFANLETCVLRPNESCPEPVCGGSYTMASPECLDDLKQLGFTHFNGANNHVMDFGQKGVLATIRSCNERTMGIAGIGEDLASASAPVYGTSSNGTVALIGVCTTFWENHRAGASNADLIGRPGIAPIRTCEHYEIEKDKLEVLRNIAALTGINKYWEESCRLGYQVDNDRFVFGYDTFVEGATNTHHISLYEPDAYRTINSVQEAKLHADIVVLSIHSHEWAGNNPRRNIQPLEDFARRAIDAGADIVFFHGPHTIRGVEVYKSGVVLHGVGNFLFQEGQQTIFPEDFYEMHGTSRDECGDGQALFDYITHGDGFGYQKVPEAWETVIVNIRCEKNEKHLIFHPVGISKQTGLPQRTTNASILEEINRLSQPYQCAIQIDNGVGFLRVPHIQR